MSTTSKNKATGLNAEFVQTYITNRIDLNLKDLKIVHWMRRTITYIQFPGNQPNAAFTEYKNSNTYYNDVIVLTTNISLNKLY